MEEIKLIVENDPKSPISETYRAIRTNLQFAGAGKQMKHIAFTSSVPGEGKSTTISNIALTMAQDGKKVLLIDNDLRKPRQHKIFGLLNKGLTNIIAMGAPFTEVVNKDVFPNLDVLTSGPIPPNPSEMLGSERMSSILKEVGDKYDYILLDLPPVLAVTDAAIMGNMADGVVLVVRSGLTSPEEANEAKKRLEAGHAHILGVVLNGVPTEKKGYGYGYYYYDYYDENHEKHHGKRKHSKGVTPQAIVSKVASLLGRQ